ncbi:MAG TPA: 16S rRNA methyltransferase [Armatimonadetes bacterium]|nr:16S rRNA methyltransferase [Armatimonadota bacterium]
MSDSARTHYFVERPEVPSEPRIIQAEVRGHRLSFVTDRGVFSYGKVDAGSRLLAEQMELDDARSILDWGCAWGLIGVVAARTWPELHVVMVDINERACQLARQNLRRNRVEAEVIAGSATEVLGDRSFDAVVCNPPISAGRAAVIALFEQAAEILNPGGSFWMVAATKKGAKTLQRELEARFAQVEQVAVRGGFRVYRAADPIIREDDGA